MELRFSGYRKHVCALAAVLINLVIFVLTEIFLFDATLSERLSSGMGPIGVGF